MPTCDFIIDEDNSILIVVPAYIPKGVPLIIEVQSDRLVLNQGTETIADMLCNRRDIIKNLAAKTKVGLIEASETGNFPFYISAVAQISLRHKIC